MGPPKNEGQFFESHGSKLEPHLGRNPGQAAKMWIAQAVLLLCIGEDPLKGFLAHGINIASVSQTKQFSQIEKLLQIHDNRFSPPVFTAVHLPFSFSFLIYFFLPFYSVKNSIYGELF